MEGDAPKDEGQLSAQALELLSYIEEYTKDHGYEPPTTVCKKELGFKHYEYWIAHNELLAAGKLKKCKRSPNYMLK